MTTKLTLGKHGIQTARGHAGGHQQGFAQAGGTSAFGGQSGGYSGAGGSAFGKGKIYIFTIFGTAPIDLQNE